MLFFYLALSTGEVGRVKPIAFAVAPAVGAILGWLALGETMTPRKLIGIATIITGVILLVGGPNTPEAPPATVTP